MSNLVVDERDVKFVLYEQFQIQELCRANKYCEFSREMFDMILDAAQKLSENEVWLTRTEGDEEGVKLENGKVRVPAGFHDAYRKFCEGGWVALSADVEHGGQGAPASLSLAAMEYFVAANLALMTYPSLTVGAARLIQKYGTDQERRTYMDKMYAGEWGGTMCLTEPQAGSDVGALRTKALKKTDGTYSIVGNKIFITSGDHDLTENIIHLVLARLEGAPPGTKGISIFIVPKKRIENGALVDNDVTTAAVEKKMGIHGSATCALNFGENEGCTGYLLGEENSGMAIMFNMMNEARMTVGLQGLSQASGAFMHALRYAQERVQGPNLSQMRDPNAAKIPIFDHPDVRRMLMWMKSFTEGMRGLLYYAGYLDDRAAIAENEEDAAKYRGLVDLLIPVCKAWCTDMAFRVTEMAVQVYAGYGYCREYPVEQFLRDVKITSIYEGTNGIQALDLLGRKLTYKRGALFMSFLAEIQEKLKDVMGNPRLKQAAGLFDEARNALIEATTDFGMKGASGDFFLPALYATPYLELFGDVVAGFILLWQAGIADDKLEKICSAVNADTPDKRARLLADNKDAAYYTGKIASAQFFANTVLSLAKGKARSITNGERSALDLPREAFPLSQ